MIVELEGLQVFPVDDGADGLVLASWIERYSSSEVRPVPRSMTVSREQANLLADELAKAADALGKDEKHPTHEDISKPTFGYSDVRYPKGTDPVGVTRETLEVLLANTSVGLGIVSRPQLEKAIESASEALK